jgi:hypothetical protein
MLTITFNEDEKQALAWLIDQAVRATGLASKPAVDKVWPKIEAAAIAAMQPPVNTAELLEEGGEGDDNA